MTQQNGRYVYLFGAGAKSAEALSSETLDEEFPDGEISVRIAVTKGGEPYSSGGGQRSMMVAVHNAELAAKIGRMNLAMFDRSRLLGGYVSSEQPGTIDDPTIKNGFAFRVADAFCMAENMLLMATELGVSSCIISRREETFVGDEGQALLREWNVPENYSAVCFVIPGYINGEQPHTKPRRPGRIRIIE